jgi:FG-GAP repeat
MRDDSNGNGNGKTDNKEVRAFEDPASANIDLTSSDSQIGIQSTSRNNKILPNDESKEEEELGFHESTQSGYDDKTYRDHVNSNTNENSNDNIIVTDDKPGNESSPTDSQIDTTEIDSQIDTTETDSQIDTTETDSQIDTTETDSQIDTTETDSQLDSSNAASQSQSESDVQPKYKSYRDFMDNNTSFSDDTINATDDTQGTVLSSTDSQAGTVNSIENVNRNINDNTINVNKNINTNNEKSNNILSLEETTSTESSSTSSSASVSASASAQVTGDFNGDGRDDLAIGVPFEGLDSATTGEEVPDAGAVHVIYGSSSGLSATTPVKNQIWTQNSPSVDDPSETVDSFGFSLGAGDFNGDGRDDLAIRVPNEDVVSAGDNAGAVNVIYGSAGGLSSTTVPDQIWTQNSGAVEDSSEAGDGFGLSLTAGDFNGDGREDLAVGVPNEDVNVADDNAGAVNVIYGSASGLSSTTVPDQIWTQNSPSIDDPSEFSDQFGLSLGAGDFNADGRDDLAIGVPFEDVVSPFDTVGAVNVIYGSSSGLSATTVPDQFWTQNSGAVEDSSEAGDGFGNSLTAGDFNGDGIDDIAIGVSFEDVLGVDDIAGAVNVIYGSASGLSSTTVPDQFWTQQSANIEGSSGPGDIFGESLASGDFNGDGRDDLAVGVPGEDVVAADDNAGAVSVIYGSSSGLSATTPLPDKFLTQDYLNVEDSSEVGDRFGDSLAAGDFSGDGIDDLAIGLPFEDIVSAGDNAGAVNVIYGSSVGLSPTQSPVFDQFFSQSAPDIGLAPDSFDRFGSSLG